MPNRSSREKHIEPMHQHIGQQIKIARLASQSSQETLADAIGVTFQQVQKYEKGVNRVSGSRLQQIADALGTHVEWFFRGRPQGPANGEPTNPGFDMLATRDGARMAALWQELTADQRRAFLDLAESIVSKAG
jgi:transcriptional regulator with XRE-family HTH domain